MLAEVALPNTASVLTKMMLCVPSRVEPPTSQGQACLDTARNGAEKKGISPSESSALIQNTQGRGWPYPTKVSDGEVPLP